MASLVIAAPPAAAQYFGQNKVQYVDLDFRVLRTEHFDIHHYPAERAAVRDAARLAERWYTRLSRLLDLTFERRQPLILYASHPHFAQTNTISGRLGVGTGGVTERLKRRVVMPFAAGLGETDHILGHELVHAFQYALGERGPSRLATLPLWFIEGMAEYLSVGPVDTATAMWLRDAAATEDLPALTDLARQRYFPYRWGHALWAYLGGRWGDDVVGRILRAAGQSGDAIGAIERVVEVDHATLSSDWHAEIQRWAASRVSSGGAAGGAVPTITEAGSGGAVNVGPALSPDGTRMVFLSERDLFSIDLYLADVETGRVVRKLVETAVDPHFDNLQFIASAGAWDPAGRRFAFAAVRRGDPVVTILDVERAARVRDVRLPELGEVYTPTWSPDGRRLAFTGLRGGYTDLFVYDLDTDTLEQVTADRFADLQPAWAPAGDRIAFVTDRFTSDGATLSFGAYRLAVVDLTAPDSAIEAVPGFAAGQQINPQWSGDGAHLYFIADPDGVANIYRLARDRGAIDRVTSVDTGVSGITASSPALSVARDGSRLAFSLYREGRHEIYTQAPPAPGAGDPIPADRRAAMLPPVPRPGGAVAAALADARTGLPPASTAYSSEPYEVDLDLDYVGQPYVLAGADRFGSFIGGGLSFLFGDMLGEHTLGFVVQSSGFTRGLDQIAGQVGYVNRASRWTWGATVEQIPFITGTFRQGSASVNGRPAIVEQEVESRRISRQVTGVTTYPFDRARRLELTAGYRRIQFDETVDTRTFSAATGELLAEDLGETTISETLAFTELGAAFVRDSSVMGPTGPLLGQRYRLDVAPTVGDLSFSTVQADYRRYVMPVRPFTVAVRGLHAGRYGPDAEDARLFPLYLGYPNLVRGYDFNSFTADECGVGAASCPVIDQLIGTRMLVANLELRFPLVGAFTGDVDYGPVPVDGVIFADAGVAWTGDVGLGERSVAKSVGAGIRAALFGAAILELDAVRPLDRPRKGWLFTVSFRPGF